MKVLSVRQPWASLIAWGDKTIEHRAWATDYRGTMLIHASRQPFVAVGDDGERVTLPYGVIVALVDLVTVRPFAPDDCKDAGMGDYLPGFAWLLANARQVIPVRANGKLHLWEWAGELRELPADQCHVEAWQAARAGVVARERHIWPRPDQPG